MQDLFYIPTKRELLQNVRRTANMLGLFLLFSLTLTTICSLFIMGAFMPQSLLFGKPIPSIAQPVTLLVSSLIGNLVPFVIAAKYFQLPLGQMFQKSKKPVSYTISMAGFCLGLSALVGLIFTLLQMLAGSVGFELGTLDIDLSLNQPAALVIYCISICVAAPFCEEFMFRGVILSAFKPYGKGFAAIISSLLFALLHGNLEQAIPAFFIGMVLCYATLSSGSLWPAITIHCINNIIGVLSILFFQSVYVTAILGLLTYVLMIFAVIMLVRFYKSRPPKTPHLYQTVRYKGVFTSAPMLVFIFCCIALTAVTLFGF